MLGALEDAARAAWGSPDREAGAGGAGGAAGSAGAARAAWAWGGGAHSMAAAEAAADRLYGSSKTIDASLAAARYEAYAGRLCGHTCLLPGWPACAAGRALAPPDRVRAAQRAARRAARVLWAVNLALDGGWEDADWAVVVEIHRPAVLQRVAAGAVGTAAALRRDYAAALAGRAPRGGAGGRPGSRAWRRPGAPPGAEAAPAEEMLEEMEAAVGELMRNTRENRHRWFRSATAWATSRRRPGAGAPALASAGEPALAGAAPPRPAEEAFALFPDDEGGLRSIMRWRALCWDLEQLAGELRRLKEALEELKEALPGGRPAARPSAGPAPADV
jgi:hypothetical protein